MGKNKKEDDKKNRKKKKNNTDSFSSEVEITKGIVWIKIFKKRINDLMN